jgi:outer membrane protein OmpA-like peptidoglycan-associated protein
MRYFRSFTLLVLTALIVSQVYAQTPQNLGNIINTPLAAEFWPTISGDGNTILFQSLDSRDEKSEVLITNFSGGTWSRPDVFAPFSVSPGTTYTGGYALSFDGNYIFFSSNRHGGVGNKDIWFIQKAGNNTWTPPVNLGKPVNSPDNEIDPSISPDGKLLYFVRENEKKTTGGLPCGKIYVAERIAGKDLWKEPVALPATINVGCECNPRILADSKTMTFASQRPGGKGEYDQYISKLQDNGTWSTPKPLTVVNTDKEDRYVSIPAKGDYVYHSIPAKTGTDLVKSMIPAELRPENVVMVRGTAKDMVTRKVMHDSRIVVINKKTNSLNVLQSFTDGIFTVALNQGDEYDFAVQANDKGYTFYSTVYDLKSLSAYREEPLNVDLLPIAINTSFVLNNIQFEEQSAKLMSFPSNNEVNRLLIFMKQNPASVIEISAHTDQVISDSVHSSADLTEMIIDTLSSNTDSLGVLTVVTKTTYHNDRTGKQARAVADALITKGIPKERIVAKGYGDKKKRIPAPSDPLLNRRVELKVIR